MPANLIPRTTQRVQSPSPRNLMFQKSQLFQKLQASQRSSTLLKLAPVTLSPHMSALMTQETQILESSTQKEEVVMSTSTLQTTRSLSLGDFGALRLWSPHRWPSQQPIASLTTWTDSTQRTMAVPSTLTSPTKFKADLHSEPELRKSDKTLAIH